MPRQLQHAYFELVVAVVAAAGYLALLPMLGPVRATGAFSVLALTAFSLFFYRKRGAEVVADERDRAIHAQSIKAVAASLWLFLVPGIGFLIWRYRASGAVPQAALILLLWFMWVIVTAVRSIAIIAQYRRL